MDTSLLSRVARVAPQSPKFAVGQNRKYRPLGVMLPVPANTPAVTVDDPALGSGEFPFAEFWQYAYYSRGYGNKSRFVAMVIPADTIGCMAFRYLRPGVAEDCFFLMLRQGRESSDAERLIKMIEQNMGEPIPWVTKDRKQAPVIEVREYKYQRRKNRLRCCLVAIHIEGEDDHHRKTRPGKPTGNHSPRPLVTA